MGFSKERKGKEKKRKNTSICIVVLAYTRMETSRQSRRCAELIHTLSLSYRERFGLLFFTTNYHHCSKISDIEASKACCYQTLCLTIAFFFPLVIIYIMLVHSQLKHHHQQTHRHSTRLPAVQQSDLLLFALCFYSLFVPSPVFLLPGPPNKIRTYMHSKRERERER